MLLAVAGFVGSALMARTRTHRIAVPSQPTVPPRNMVLVDSWHTVISTLGGEATAIKQRIAKPIAYADPGGISTGFETYSYRTPYGYEERDRLTVIKNQSIVHLHVYPIADDLFVGWHAYLNCAQWGESTTVSRRVADGVVTEFRELRPANYTPNQFDLIDLNSLSELVHRHIERELKRLMTERTIDQEIDFEIIRGDRTRSFDRAHQAAEAHGGGLWSRIMRGAAAWQPRSETDIRRSTAALAAAAAPISLGVGGLGYLAGLLGWIVTGFEFSMFLLVLVPISREFAVPLTEVTVIFSTTLWLRAFGGVVGRLDGRSHREKRAPRAGDPVDGDLQRRRRASRQLLGLFLLPRRARYRHGRRMDDRHRACDGGHARPVSRRDGRPFAGRLRHRLSAGERRLSHVL